MNFGRFVDLSNFCAHEEPGCDEANEADDWNFDEIFAGGEAQEDESDHGGDELQADGVWISAEKALDVKMLFDPAKEEFDLPALFVEACDLDGRSLHVVCHE